MKSIRDIYLKLRDVKFHHQVILYKKYFKSIPENCKYNTVHYISGAQKDVSIRLCTLHQPDRSIGKVFPNLIEVCSTPGHCTNCNAFVCKYTKNDIQKIFLEELKDKRIKVRKYPDIVALEWVLCKSDSPSINLFHRIRYRVKKILTKKLL